MSKTPAVSLICASRGRPDGVRSMAESALDRAGDPDAVEILIYVDQDDPLVEAYRSGLPDGLLKRISIEVGPPIRPVASVNVLSERSRGALLATTPDDLVFETQNWDTRLTQVARGYPDEICCVFPDDGGRAGAEVATQPFITRRVYELLGYHLFPACLHYGADLWTHELFKRLDRLIYVGDVRVVHRHQDTGRAAMDATYAHASPLERLDTDLFIKLSRWMPVEEEILRRQMRPTAAELARSAMGGA